MSNVQILSLKHKGSETMDNQDRSLFVICKKKQNNLELKKNNLLQQRLIWLQNTFEADKVIYDLTIDNTHIKINELKKLIDLKKINEELLDRKIILERINIEKLECSTEMLNFEEDMKQRSQKFLSLEDEYNNKNQTNIIKEIEKELTSTYSDYVAEVGNLQNIYDEYNIDFKESNNLLLSSEPMQYELNNMEQQQQKLDDTMKECEKFTETN